MKRFLSLFLTFILIFNTTILSFSYADTIEELTGVGFEDVTATDTQGEDLDLDNDLDPLDTQPATDSIFTKILNSILGFMSWINIPLVMLIYALPSIDGCIFNSQPYFKLSFFDSEHDDWELAGNIQGYIGAVYNAFRYLVTAAYIVILVYLGVRMILSSVGRQKAQYKELFKHWLIGLLILFSFHWVMAGLIWLSNTFVDILANTSSQMLEDILANLRDYPNPFSSSITQETIDANPITSFLVYNISIGTNWLPIIGALLASLLYVALFGAALVFAFTYLKRLFTIALLIVLFPFVALSYVFDKIGDRKAQTLGLWIKEFSVNVMVQPIHALLLVLISLLYSTAASSALYGANILGAIMSLLSLLLIPVGEKLLKQLFQINSSMGVGSGGIGRSLAQAGLAFKGAKDLGKSISKTGSTFRAMSAAKKQAGLSGMKNRWDAFNEGKKTGKSFSNRLHDATSLRKNEDSVKKYKKILKDNLGTDDMKKLYGKASAELRTQLVASAFGIGTNLASSDSLTQFGAKAATSIAIGASTAEVGRKMVQSVWGDAKASKDYQGRIDTIKKNGIENLTTQQKAKIKAEIGIDLDKIDLKDEATKARTTERVLNDYAALERYSRFGGTDKETMKGLTSNAMAVKNIENGKMADGSGPLDKSRYTVTQDKKDAVYTDTVTGEQIFFEGKGNSAIPAGKVIERPLDKISEPLTPEVVQQYVKEDSKVKDAARALDHSVANYNEQQEILQNHQAVLQENTTKRDTLKSEVQTITTERATLREETQTASQRRSTIKAELDTATSTRNTLESEIQVATSAHNTLEPEVQAAQIKRDELHTQLRQAEKSLSSAKFAVKVEPDSPRTAKLLAEQEQIYAQAKAAFQQADTTYTQKAAEFERINTTIAQKTEELERARATITQKSTEFTQADSIFNQKSTELDDVNSRYDTKATELQQVTETIKHTEKEITRTETKIERTERDMQRNAQTLRNAEDTATDKIETMFGSMSESLTGNYSTQEDVVAYRPDFIGPQIPESAPILPRLLITGDPSNEIKDFLSGKHRSFIEITDEGLMVQGQLFPGTGLSDVSNPKKRRLIYIKLENGDWVVED